MTNEELDALTALMLESAKENLERDGHLLPAGLIICGNKMSAMALDYRDTEADKQRVAELFISRAKELKADAVITIFDAWMAEVKELPLDKRVRDIPEAREAIIVSGHKADYQTMHAAVYTKTERGYEFENQDAFKGTAPGRSRFTDGIFETHSVTDAPQ